MRLYLLAEDVSKETLFATIASLSAAALRPKKTVSSYSGEAKTWVSLPPY